MKTLAIVIHLIYVKSQLLVCMPVYHANDDDGRKERKSKHSGVYEIEMEMLSAANDHSALNYCCTKVN